MGCDAGRQMTTGIRNTLIGGLSGDALTDADYNTVVGMQALTSDTLGSKSTAIGYSTLNNQNFTTATDSFNVAVGYEAGTALTTGIQNTFIGAFAGDSLLTSNNNVLVGYAAGNAITTGASNTFIGSLVGDGTDDGSANVAIGQGTLRANCGDDNCAVGTNALELCTGTNNTGLGTAAGAGVTSGINNMVLGHDAGRTGSPGGNITTGNNIIALGDENIGACHIQTDWTIASDQRDKTDFTALDVGLDFVKALNPVTYKWDKRSKYGDKKADDYDLDAQTPDGTHKEDWLDVGFKAQEVEVLEKAAGYKIADKTNLVTSLSNDGKQYGMQYNKFVPILVKAIQELSAKNDALEARIATLEG